MMEFFKEAENWVAIAFVIFIGVLIYVGVHKKIIEALDHRAIRIKNELDEARKLRDEAAALLAEYQKKQREAEQEAAAIVAEAKAEAVRVAAESHAKLEEFVARRSKLAETKIGRCRGRREDPARDHQGRHRRQAGRAGHPGREGEAQLSSAAADLTLFLIG
jgi:F-type H+-transporting ATPase subunit b